MKFIAIILMTVMLSKGCNSENKEVSQKDIETASIEYIATTRGFYTKINIKNKMVSISKDRNGNDTPVQEKISDADWKELITEFGKIDLENIPNLKDPTQKRFYDGAAIASISIDYKGKTYKSQNFDHKIPPLEIEKFVNKVVSFSKKTNED